MIMGAAEQQNKYGNLERWTRQAREYSESMFKFNMIDDILAEAVNRSNKKSEKNDRKCQGYEGGFR